MKRDATITGLERLKNSRDGNPQFLVTIDGGATYRTKANTSDAYKLCSYYIGRRVTLEMTRFKSGWQIVGIGG